MNKISIRQKITLIIFGFFLFVALLEIGLRIAGFVFLSVQEYRNRISGRQEGAYRIMCLGESNTALGGRNSYPSQLQEVLNQRNIGIKFSVINKGLPGTNTTVILSQLEDNLNKYAPDMVITMMGGDDKDASITDEHTWAEKSRLLFSSFRIYKLIGLLREYIIDKSRAIAIYKLEHIPGGENIPTQFKKQGRESGANLGSDWMYIGLGRRYTDQGEHAKAIKMYKKALQINPRNDLAYTALGGYYIDQKEYAKAEQMFRKSLRINPKNNWAYVGLGGCYSFKGEYNKAIEIFSRALQIDPGNDAAYVGLGRCYLLAGEYNKAIEMFTEALEINPANDGAYSALGWYYRSQGEYAKAREIYKKILDLEIKPKNDLAYVGLGWYYRSRRDYAKAEEMYKKALQINPRNVWPYAALAYCYKEQGKGQLAEQYFEKANRLKPGYYSPVTQHNYWRLRRILAQRGIRLVCVQYPMRSIEPLKKILEPNQDIIFVDNEHIFKQAVNQANYSEYFIDIFGGDFGHCTPKGNRLLAENIANVILKECFNKEIE